MNYKIRLLIVSLEEDLCPFLIFHFWPPGHPSPVESAAECVLLSRTDSLLNLRPLYIVVSTKVTSVHDISAVNLIVGCCLFACSMNFSGTSLLVCQRKIVWSM